MTAIIIYAAASKTMRRIIVSDTMTPDQIAASYAVGEAALLIPNELYRAMTERDLRNHLAQQIGDPLHDGLCVELDAKGTVVARYVADPAIDKPLVNVSNTIELHAAAAVGDIKLKATGEFISMAPVQVIPKADIIVSLNAAAQKLGVVLQDVSAQADTILADQQTLIAKQQQAIAQK